MLFNFFMILSSIVVAPHLAGDRPPAVTGKAFAHAGRHCPLQSPMGLAFQT